MNSSYTSGSPGSGTCCWRGMTDPHRWRGMWLMNTVKNNRKNTTHCEGGSKRAIYMTGLLWQINAAEWRGYGTRTWSCLLLLLVGRVVHTSCFPHFIKCFMDVSREFDEFRIFFGVSSSVTYARNLRTKIMCEKKLRLWLVCGPKCKNLVCI